MSTRYNNGSHYENHQQAAELHDAAAHAHNAAAAQHGNHGAETGQEHSKREREHSEQVYFHTKEVLQQHSAHSAVEPGHEDIARLAHELWMGRGCPAGSSEEDWFEAKELLSARKKTAA